MSKHQYSVHKVFYAEDDPEDIEFVKEQFSKYSKDIELVPFPNGNELLNFSKNHSPSYFFPCLIILDVNMPGLNGKEVLKKLSLMREYERVPVVLFSNSSLPSEVDFAHRLGAEFITKPYHRNQILQLVNHILHHCSDNFKKLFKRN